MIRLRSTTFHHILSTLKFCSSINKLFNTKYKTTYFNFFKYQSELNMFNKEGGVIKNHNLHILKGRCIWFVDANE